MKHKTAELEGALLDAAVAKAQGLTARVHPSAALNRETECMVGEGDDPWRWDAYAPSTEWEQGGPIIERERMAMEWRDGEEWWNGEWVRGARWLATVPGGTPTEIGPTPLIAAMRAYTASVFGDEVELP